MISEISIAMIFAAGLGTRLKPWTDHHPKALALVNGKSLLQRNIEYLQKFDIKNVVVNIHHFPNQIKDAISSNNGWGSNVLISDETEEVLETGGGLQKAQPLLQGKKHIVVLNVDILTDLDLEKMIEQHLTTKALATLAVTDRKTSRYFLFDTENQLCGWKNINTNELKGKEGKMMAFSGIHIIDTNIFSYIKQTGKFSMIDIYLSLMDNHKIICYNHTGSKFIDVGKPESIAKAEEMFM